MRRLATLVSSTLLALTAIPSLAQDDTHLIFLHVASSANTLGATSLLDHPAINGDPDRPIIVQQVLNPQGDLSGVETSARIGLAYSLSTNRWSLETQDLSPIALGTRFFVLVPGAAAAGTALIHELTPTNTAGAFTTIDSTALNGRPEGGVLTTWIRNPGGGSGPRLDVNVGALYDDELGKWQVRTLNAGGIADDPLPTSGGLAVFAFVYGGTPSFGGASRGVTDLLLTLVTSSSTNTSGSEVRSPWSGRRNFFFAGLVDPPSVCTLVDRKCVEGPLAVKWGTTDGKWRAYHVDGTVVPAGYTFAMFRFEALFWDGFERGDTSVWD